MTESFTYEIQDGNSMRIGYSGFFIGIGNLIVK